MAGIGIDFGTSNTLIALYTENTGSESLLISQQLDKDLTHTRKSLSSAVHIKNSGEMIIGEYARKLSTTEPEKSILSVKSWLCNNLVSRTDAILPWGEDSVEQKYSPLDIASSILEYAMNSINSSSVDKSIFQDDSIKKVLTIPASFDEVARQLTEKAAQKAGLGNFVFLEEPLAALYAWLSEHQEDWREHIQVGDLILVCDIGGGTTDFTMVGVQEVEGKLSLERYSVGEHILLGGDNIDLALTYLLAAKAEEENTPLDSWQMKACVQILRELKEKALSEEKNSDNTPQEEMLHLAVPSRSSNLFAKSLGFKLPKSFFTDQIFDGFFPLVDITEAKVADDSGLSESGLPFESDPRFTVHLLSFLKQSFRTIRSSESLLASIPSTALDQEKGILVPTKILFNGGVCNSTQTREKILTQIQTWFPESSITALPSGSYDESVSKGAAYYSFLKTSGEHIPVKAGVAHALYLGVKENTLAVPGIKPKIKGVCVLPQGTPEGSEFVLKNIPLSLRKGQISEFILYSSKERADDSIGIAVADAEKNLTRHHTITSSIHDETNSEEIFDKKSALVPVTLRVKATEAGSLELWMDEVASKNSHQVEFKIR